MYGKTLEELESMNSSYQTSFWIEHNQWSPVCEYEDTDQFYYCFYTIPICTSKFKYNPNLKRLPSSAVTMMTESSTVKSVSSTISQHYNQDDVT